MGYEWDRLSLSLSVFTELYSAAELHVDSQMWGGNCGENDAGRMSRNYFGKIYLDKLEECL